MENLRKSYLKKYKNMKLSKEDYKFLSEELRVDISTIKDII